MTEENGGGRGGAMFSLTGGKGTVAEGVKNCNGFGSDLRDLAQIISRFGFCRDVCEMGSK